MNNFQAGEQKNDNAKSPQNQHSKNDPKKSVIKSTTSGQDGNATVQTNNNGAVMQTFSEDDYSQLKNELEETQKKLEEMTKITQHALADLQNFRRRSEEDRKTWIVYANLELLKELLPTIDNMNRAIEHEPKDAQWAKGAEQIIRQFLQTLERRNLKIIPTKSQKFDPKLHEALLTAPGEKDLILEELEKGYMLGEKVLKLARVKVGSGETVNN